MEISAFVTIIVLLRFDISILFSIAFLATYVDFEIKFLLTYKFVVLIWPKVLNLSDYLLQKHPLERLFIFALSRVPWSFR